MSRLSHTALSVCEALAPGAVAWWLAREISTPRPVPLLPLPPPEAVATVRRIPLRDSYLALTEWGAGRIVLLVHGWGARSESFHGLVDPLVEAGLRPVAVDLPAHGRSGGSRTTMIHCAEAVRVAAEAVGPVHAVIGHSFGGPTAALALAQGLLADRLVMAAPPLSVHAALRTAALAQGVSEHLFSRVARGFEQRLAFEWSALDTDRLVARLHARLLVVHDDGDRVTPVDDGRAVAEAVPQAVFVRTSGLGHRAVLADSHVAGHVRTFLLAP